MTENSGNIIQQLMDYVNPAMWGVVLALWFIGWILKQTPRIPNWSILFVLVVLGIVAGLVILGLNADAVIQGIIVAAVAVLGYEGYKQTRKAVDAVKSNTDA